MEDKKVMIEVNIDNKALSGSFYVGCIRGQDRSIIYYLVVVEYAFSIT